MRRFVSGLVLAAGASTRLGQPKQLLPFRSTTLLGHVSGTGPWHPPFKFVKSLPRGSPSQG